MFTSRAKTEKFTRHVFRYCERSFFSRVNAKDCRLRGTDRIRIAPSELTVFLLREEKRNLWESLTMGFLAIFVRIRISS
ncbi:DUF1661 domain-containing protein [Porphyromonas gingivalis]|uniref:DUF1661 domain-containing protein n=1 Tax=Porphyromonas gingivalis TaxID=837 RepID=UPI001E3B9A08|nr:DUF1661 domain-containing protein [Porphyromonas gingivalis]